MHGIMLLRGWQREPLPANILELDILQDDRLSLQNNTCRKLNLIVKPISAFGTNQQKCEPKRYLTYTKEYREEDKVHEK